MFAFLVGLCLSSPLSASTDIFFTRNYFDFFPITVSLSHAFMFVCRSESGLVMIEEDGNDKTSLLSSSKQNRSGGRSSAAHTGPSFDALRDGGSGSGGDAPLTYEQQQTAVAARIDPSMAKYLADARRDDLKRTAADVNHVRHLINAVDQIANSHQPQIGTYHQFVVMSSCRPPLTKLVT